MSAPAEAIAPIAKSTPDAAKGASAALERGGTKPETNAEAYRKVHGGKKKPPAARKAGASPLAGGTSRATATSAKRIVLFSVIAAGSAVALRDFKRGTVPSIRVGVGVLFAGIFLSALADVIPEVAGPLGLLVLVGAFLLPGANGEPSVGADLLSSVRSIAKK